MIPFIFSTVFFICIVNYAHCYKVIVVQETNNRILAFTEIALYFKGKQIPHDMLNFRFSIQPDEYDANRCNDGMFDSSCINKHAVDKNNEFSKGIVGIESSPKLVISSKYMKMCFDTIVFYSNFTNEIDGTKVYVQIDDTSGATFDNFQYDVVGSITGGKEATTLSFGVNYGDDTIGDILHYCMYSVAPPSIVDSDRHVVKKQELANRMLREALAAYACTEEMNMLLSVLHGGYCLVEATDVTSVYTGRGYNSGNLHAYGHFPGDVGMSQALSGLLPRNSKVLDVGAGQGQYKYIFSQIRPDVDWFGVDGAINVEQYTQEFVHYHDICVDHPVEWNLNFDWVVSIEVAEHLPIECQEEYIFLLTQTSRYGVVLSWSDEYAPPHHINPRNNSYVKQLLGSHGFISDELAETQLRESVSELLYLKDTLMVFRNTNI